MHKKHLKTHINLINYLKLIYGKKTYFFLRKLTKINQTFTNFYENQSKFNEIIQISQHFTKFDENQSKFDEI